MCTAVYTGINNPRPLEQRHAMVLYPRMPGRWGKSSNGISSVQPQVKTGILEGMLRAQRGAMSQDTGTAYC